MRMDARVIGISVLCLLIATVLSADMKTVTIDLNSGQITGPVPFDEEFLIVGDADAQAQRISLEYGEVPGMCGSRNQSAPAKETSCSGAEVVKIPNPTKADDWTRTSSGAAKFGFRIGKLKPNGCYAFRFTQHLGTPAAEDRKKLQDALSKQVRTLLIDKFAKGSLNTTDEQATKDEITLTANRFVQEQFHACMPQIDFARADIQKALNDVLQVSENVKTAEENVKSNQTNIISALCLHEREVACNPETRRWATHLRDDLEVLLSDPSILTVGSLETWQAKLNPARDGHRETTMAQFARALASGLPPSLALKGVVAGSMKFAGPTIESSAASDETSIELLADFIEVYTSASFQRKVKGGGSEPIVETTLAEKIHRNVGLSANVGLRRLPQLLRVQTLTKQKLETTAFPDILAEAVLDRKFDVSISPTVVTEGKNPYIAADVGFGYVAKANKPFLYAGANFYFIPVNKAERQIPRWGIEGFLKRFSILTGLTSSGPDGDGIENLFGPGNLMVGGGWRFNKYVKANLGVIAFKQRDENPLVDKKRVKSEPFFSLSIDMDVRQLLGNFGKLFGP